MVEIYIESVSDLISEVIKLKNKPQTIHWFRGQRLAKWHLEPKVFRKEHAKHERNYVHRFRARARTRYASAPAYGNFALWISLMQHYGLSTRLLDWSRSPLVAAYFAVQQFIYNSKAKPEDAAIWILDPHTLNMKECGDSTTPEIEADSVQELINPAFSDKYEENDEVRAVMSSELDIRMFVQQGCFTIHSDRKPLNRREQSHSYITKLIIPAKNIYSFSSEVEACGLRKGDIFPDLQNLSDELNIKKGL